MNYDILYGSFEEFIKYIEDNFMTPTEKLNIYREYLFQIQRLFNIKKRYTEQDFADETALYALLQNPIFNDYYHRYLLNKWDGDLETQALYYEQGVFNLFKNLESFLNGISTEIQYLENQNEIKELVEDIQGGKSASPKIFYSDLVHIFQTMKSIGYFPERPPTKKIANLFSGVTNFETNYNATVGQLKDNPNRKTNSDKLFSFIKNLIDFFDDDKILNDLRDHIDKLIKHPK